MKITLAQRHLFNDSKPMVKIWDPTSSGWCQWDNCDLSDCPPYRLKGSMTAHGKFPTYKYEELPKIFIDTNGNEHRVEDIIAYMSSK
jgi:hypothetical protein